MHKKRIELNSSQARRLATSRTAEGKEGGGDPFPPAHLLCFCFQGGQSCYRLPHRSISHLSAMTLPVERKRKDRGGRRREQKERVKEEKHNLCKLVCIIVLIDFCNFVCWGKGSNNKKKLLRTEQDVWPTRSVVFVFFSYKTSKPSLIQFTLIRGKLGVEWRRTGALMGWIQGKE